MRRAAVLTLIVLAAAGCGDQDAGLEQEILTVEQAIARAGEAEGPFSVRGFVVARDEDDARLCASLQESPPPGCGEPSLALDGLDAERFARLERSDGVFFSDEALVVTGDIEQGTLKVSDVAD